MRLCLGSGLRGLALGLSLVFLCAAFSLEIGVVGQVADGFLRLALRFLEDTHESLPTRLRYPLRKRAKRCDQEKFLAVWTRSAYPARAPRRRVITKSGGAPPARRTRRNPPGQGRPGGRRRARNLRPGTGVSGPGGVRGRAHTAPVRPRPPRGRSQPPARNERGA